MLYIIDANNLAGRLEILKQENFDKKLASLVIEFLKNKNNKAFLVFDSTDPNGDKITYNNNVDVIYAPRCEHGNSADHKILEILEKQNNKDEIILVTDDIELKEKAKIISDKSSKNLKLEKTLKFAFKLEKYFKNDIIEEDDLDRIAKNDINNELLNTWK